MSDAFHEGEMTMVINVPTTVVVTMDFYPCHVDIEPGVMITDDEVGFDLMVGGEYQRELYSCGYITVVELNTYIKEVTKLASKTDQFGQEFFEMLVDEDGPGEQFVLVDFTGTIHYKDRKLHLPTGTVFQDPDILEKIHAPICAAHQSIVDAIPKHPRRGAKKAGGKVRS